MKEKEKQAEKTAEQKPVADRRHNTREWLAQVDFWEGVKEFILKRIPSSSRPVDQLY